MKIETKYGGDPQFAPQFICDVFEILSTRGGACEAAVIKKLAAPASGELFDQHISLSVKLGIFDDKDGMLSIPQATSVKSIRLTPKTLSRYLCDVLMRSEMPTSLNSLQALLLWAYSIRPVHEVSGRMLETIPKKWEEFEVFASNTGLHGKDRVFSGKDQFPATRRWLEAMGLMVDVGKDTYLLSHELASDSFLGLVPKGSVPIRSVVDEFRKVSPFLPGGKWNKLWMDTFTAATPKNLNAVAQVQANEMSGVESLILTNLRIAGVIKLENKNDAPDLMKLSVMGHDEQMVSHIELITKAGE